MKELIGHSANTYLVPSIHEDKLIPMVELILLTSEPRYQSDVSGFVKTRAVMDTRLSVAPKALRELAALFTALADEADKVAADFNPEGAA